MEVVKERWKKVRLGEVCEKVNYGYTASAEYSRVGPKFLRITDIVLENIDWDKVPYCQIEEKNIPKFLLKEGDIVIARTGATVGYAKYIKKGIPTAVFASYLVRIRLKKDFDARDIGFLIESDIYKRFIKANISGAAQPQANAQVLTSYPAPIAPLNVQRKIAAILSAYDDLIENNTRRIQILEEMAQTIYKEWFVKFRFPGYEKVKMVYSELGRIPEGWMVKPSSQVLEINPRINVNKESEKPFVFMEDVSNTSMVIRCRTRREGLSGSKFQNGDTLFARITPSLENGKIGFVQFLSSDNEVGLGSTEFIVLRSKHLCPEYAYLLARTEKFRGNAIKSMIGASGRQRVQEACFDHFFLAVPPPSKIERFHGYIAPIFKNIHLLSLKNGILRRTRDLLLPKLISEEIDVDDLDINTEELEQ